MKKPAIALCCLLFATTAVFGQRLDRTVIPNHYDLTLAPNFGDDTFSGVEGIEVTIEEPTQSIELHAVDLEIGSATVVAGGSVQAATVRYDTERETVHLDIQDAVRPGPATLHLEFTGRLNLDLRGFYLGVDGSGHKYAGSQMESTDARRALPSFDEPWMKATFAITMIIDEGHTAFSNGALVSDTPGPTPGKHTVRFAVTPRMSSYLLALVAGRFSCLEDEHRGLPLRVCATPEQVELGQYALEATKAVLTYYDAYFDYPYPFGKLDQIAIADFAAGAMENTAAIVYRETALLLDPEHASTSQRRRVAGVVAHEIAHMWFGDLVTMSWWNDIWLNEGFATFMAAKSVGDWKPEWGPEVADAASTGYPIDTDVLSSTRRIRQQATTPEEIDALFDGIAYQKTAAVLRTVESYLGEETMRRGIADYMHSHAYGNTTAEDFFDALSEAGGKDVAAIMRSYVNQPGIPAVSIRTRCEGGATVASLAQQRFFADRSLLGSAPDQVWSIPLCVAEQDCFVLDQPTAEARFTECRQGAFANWRGRGYYITDYGASIAESAAKQSPGERVALLRDQWYLLRIGQLQIADYLDLVAAIAPAEHERRVVDEYLQHLQEIEEYLVADADRPALHEWMQATLRPLAHDLGWRPAAEDDVTTMELRASVYAALGLRAADPEVRVEARRLAEAYLADPSAVDPTMASTVLEVAARDGDATLYEHYRAALDAAATPEEASRLREALARFDDPALLRRNIDFVLSDALRSQDRGRFLFALVQEPAGLEAVWQFAKEHWDELMAKLPAPAHQYVLPALGQRLCSAEDRADFEAFAARVDTVAAPRRMALARESIAGCVDLKALHQGELSTYLHPSTSDMRLN
jgi:puromycin-sensitive aminopeptidase